jgi:hypothetical protein
MKTIICDLCKENEGMTLSIQISCELGPTGGKETHLEYVDICLGCLIRVLKDFLREEPLDVARRFLGVIKESKQNEKIALIS